MDEEYKILLFDLFMSHVILGLQVNLTDMPIQNVNFCMNTEHSILQKLKEDNLMEEYRERAASIIQAKNLK